tara:strand:+ start:4490 stop:4699 length:210 start_codon:yes stop_codon:yes gene_type:complete
MTLSWEGRSMDPINEDAQKSDIEMLITELQENSLAARLLAAWSSSDPSRRQEKLLEVLRSKDEDTIHAS